MTNVWETIPAPAGNEQFTYRLADADHPLDMYWARDRKGHPAFRFRGTFDREATTEAPQMAGIICSSETLGDWTYFNLVLEDHGNADIFLALCTSLLRVTRSLDDGNDGAGLQIVISHLKRWQEILRQGRSRKLSDSEQAGLFGELLVLRDVFMRNLDCREAVASWTGPFPDEQDFGYSGNLVEVKTKRSTRDGELSISSLDQLDTTSGRISLVFQTLAVFEDGPPTAITLNALVDQISGEMGDHPDALGEFLTRLKLMRYDPDPAYDKKAFVLANRRFFDVRDGFPRIERSDVRVGVSKASYSIMVDACLPFEQDPDVAVRNILAGLPDPEVEERETPVGDLVRFPESTELEFKSSLRWCYKEGRKNTALESIIVKTVAALANTRGGKLVIGVDDDNRILGLDPDYSTLNPGSGRNGFELHLSQLLENAFGAPFVATRINIDFPVVEGMEICVVSVSRNRPIVPVEKVDKHGKRSKCFYVRLGNRSKELPVEDIIHYNQDE